SYYYYNHYFGRLMVIQRKHFPEIISDNEEVYFEHLKAILEARDELASMEITKLSYGYHFRIAPSTSIYIESIIQAVIDLNNNFGIKVDFGKSIKSSSTISFKITM